MNITPIEYEKVGKGLLDLVNNFSRQPMDANDYRGVYITHNSEVMELRNDIGYINNQLTSHGDCVLRSSVKDKQLEHYKKLAGLYAHKGWICVIQFLDKGDEWRNEHYLYIRHSTVADINKD